MEQASAFRNHAHLDRQALYGAVGMANKQYRLGHPTRRQAIYLRLLSNVEAGVTNWVTAKSYLCADDAIPKLSPIPPFLTMPPSEPILATPG